MVEKIIEIWGDGNNVIIKFKKKGFNGIWYAASEWMTVSYPYTDKFLKDNGYRKLNLKDFNL